MADKFTFSSAGEIQEVEFALARAGYTHPEVKELTKGIMLSLVREVIHGTAEICRIERLALSEAVSVQSNVYVIDCDALPRIPSGFSLEGKGAEHRKMGKITLEKRADGKLYANGIEIVRYLSPNQQNGKVIQGHKLREELKDKQVLNACILDALLAHPELIPDEWKTGYTYFWGTTFRRADGLLFVEFLDWYGDGWCWHYDWLGHVWCDGHPAASLAS